MHIKHWVLSALAVGGCAGASTEATSPDFGDRLARLEARLGQLEAAPSSAGTGPDASAFGTAEPIMMNEAGAGKGIHVHVISHGSADGAPAAAANFRSCLKDAEQRCRLVIVQERSASGLPWKRRVYQRSASDTPEGRSCLANLTRQCQGVRQAAERIDERFKRLDSELSTATADSALAAKLAQAIEQDSGAPLDVVCTKRFCRVRGLGPGGANWSKAEALLGSSIAVMTRGDVVYVTRDGYEFAE